MKMEAVDRFKIENHGVELSSNDIIVRIELADNSILRIRQFSKNSDHAVESNILCENEFVPIPAKIEEYGDMIKITGDSLVVHIYLDPFWVDLASTTRGSIFSTPRGKSIERTGEKSLHRFNLPAGAQVYGLGQGTSGTLNLRDQERRMWQQWDGFRYSGNGGIPFMITSQGYGLLLNSSWPSRFALGKAEPAKSTPAAKPEGPWKPDEHSGERNQDGYSIITNGGEMDLFIIYGPDYQTIFKGYCRLTGYPPLPPRWALGFIQSKNRYKSQEQILAIGRDYRKKGIPCDTLVIDWCWFKYFGDLDWVKKYWPDPDGMFRELQAMGYHMLQAQHPYMHPKSVNYGEFNDKGYLITWDPSEVTDGWPPDGIKHIVDFTHPGARNLWWEKIEPLFKQGIDGYWTDMGEPDTHPPSSSPGYLGPREKVHNIYTLLWNKGLYEGQRSSSNRRVFCLSRTAYAGIQRYGAALWSGDIDPSWEVLEDQVVVGQQVCLSGLPYWTTDIGGFMSTEFYEPELYARWIQWGAFCPIFRTHGTRPDNEPWSFGPMVEEIIVKYIKLRYQLMPYIYSLAYESSQTGLPMMRAMVIEFPEDEEASSRDHQFMFGPSLLVAPVTKKGVRNKKVWLPDGVWYNYWDGQKYAGLQEIEELAPLWKLPIYVRAGSIIPEGPEVLHTGGSFVDPLTLHVYPGKDAMFTLYEDDGCSYDYENGSSSITSIQYNEKSKKLRILGAKGVYLGLKLGRAVKVIFHDSDCPKEIKLNGVALKPQSWRYSSYLRKLEIDLNRIHIASDAILELAGVVQREGEVLTGKTNALLSYYDLEYIDSLPFSYIIRLYLDNTTGNNNIAGKAAIKPPVGWSCENLDGEDFVIGPGGNIIMRFRLSAGGRCFTASSKAIAVIDSPLGGESKEIQLGSGWAGWWKLARILDVTGPEQFDQVYAPEEDGIIVEEMIKAGATITDYRSFECFGYVNLEKFFNDKDITEMVATTTEYKLCYASCVAESPDERECYMQLMGEDRFKVWINNQLVAVVDHCVAKPAEYLVKLKKGDNSILIKCAHDAHMEWNDRSWGFYFRFSDDERKPLNDIFYTAESRSKSKGEGR